MNFKGSPVNIVGSGTGRRLSVNELAIAWVRLTSWVNGVSGDTGWGSNGLACGFSGFSNSAFWDPLLIWGSASSSIPSGLSKLLYALTRAAAPLTSLSACSCCSLIFSSSSFYCISASLCLISASICVSLTFHSLFILSSLACWIWSLCIAFACSCLAARSASASARLLQDFEVVHENLLDPSDDS